MTFGFAILVLVVVGLGVGGILVGLAPLFVIPIAFAIVLAGAVLSYRAQRKTLPIELERESIEFGEEDYDTLAPRPEHTHGSVKRGPTRRPGATP
jgi:hypothetical protein